MCRLRCVAKRKLKRPEHDEIHEWLLAYLIQQVAGHSRGANEDGMSDNAHDPYILYAASHKVSQGHYHQSRLMQALSSRDFVHDLRILNLFYIDDRLVQI